ncbi:MAG TPA: sigma-70 family RNA polymerase sigma factor [Clostridiales bacterium]|nr:sigma-70 family RNA polymerase sigma factor [Clostridiales bacterium]HOL79017.1 sigma-70 family RNA polymerase sigma factor [Clostridiales bacterium]HPU66898.1 sigma-70 family RNA polymerase sigma factor [Clostridiales bacterium]HQD72365.1 sigma-70 family RNA polymerase sigma factor [Clostridiales bacterium]HXK83215.1 sigma-70 family RNA polymerase sigma factor [Clostridiales bacterium]
MNEADKKKQALITENLGLVHACAARFKGRGVEYDDLFQAGCVGLIKASEGFDESLGYAFSTYAVPAILGEIKRIFRDGGTVKIGRAAKEKARQLLKAKEELTNQLDREPTISELAEYSSMSVPETAELICAATPPLSLTAENEDNENQEMDIPVPSSDEGITDRLALHQVMQALDETDRNIIDLRYFKGLTQTVTAKKLGMSQVQVSRREKVILLKLRELLSS